MEIKITYLKKIDKTNCYLIEGYYTTNNDPNAWGFKVKGGLWIPYNLITLDKSAIGKTLEYFCNERGNVALAKLKVQ